LPRKNTCKATNGKNDSDGFDTVKKSTVLFGNGKYASAIYHYLTHNSDLKVVAFTVDEQYIDTSHKHNLPVVAFEKVEQFYPPDKFRMLIALSFKQQNQLRYQRYLQAKQKGFQLASYVASTASVWNADIGENCIILDQVVMQPYVTVGANTIISSNAFIGHHSTIGNNCFISAHATIAGGVTIGEFSLIGMNSSVREGIQIGKSCTVGSSSAVIRNIDDGQTVVGIPAKQLERK
jgi:sugar O-acyltransferase (sialic acid O-acetyltransferase NeuD family)